MIQQLVYEPRISTQLLDEGNKTAKPAKVGCLDQGKIASSIVVDSNQWMIPRMI